MALTHQRAYDINFNQAYNRGLQKLGFSNVNEMRQTLGNDFNRYNQALRNYAKASAESIMSENVLDVARYQRTFNRHNYVDIEIWNKAKDFYNTNKITKNYVGANDLNYQEDLFREFFDNNNSINTNSIFPLDNNPKISPEEVNNIMRNVRNGNGGQYQPTNNVTGGADDDYLDGANGSDIINGDDGDDILVGGSGHDVLDGGANNDILVAGGSMATEEQIRNIKSNKQNVNTALFESDTLINTLYGGDGSDVLVGDMGKDYLYGDAGNDYIYGGKGEDYIEGGSGNDYIYGGDDKDTIKGGDGDDKIYGDNGDDNIDGGIGNDTIYGGAGRDTIDGGAGNDKLYAGAGNGDVLKGGDGNDSLYNYEGSATLQGDVGYDTYYINSSSTNIIYDEDNKGSINFNSKNLNGAGKEYYKGNDTWVKDGVTYSWTGNTLSINGKTTVQNFSNGALGITLVKPKDDDEAPIDSDDKMTEPIVMDLNGDGAKTTIAAQGINFDYNNDGFAEKIAWADINDGVLVADLNNNGKIDNGSEVLTAETLADFDTNNDGIIDENDENFSALKVMKLDGSLLSMEEAEIASINTSVTSTDTYDENGNNMFGEGTFTKTDGSVNSFGEYNLVTDFSNTQASDILEETEDVAELPDIEGQGRIYSLHQAMMHDLSGDIHDLVEDFVSETDDVERESLIEQMNCKRMQIK